MELLLVLFGLITGFVSGFFGIGGGTILVPLLLLSGFDMKSAVAISIMQMIFSSIYGSFLNAKTTQNLFKDGVILGFGGFLGGLLSGIIVPNVNGEILKYTFLAVLMFSIYRVAITSTTHNKEIKEHNKFLLILIGFLIGTIAMSIGVGGSVILSPILVGFMYYNLKNATSLGLFFVIFSSIAGFISLSLSGNMLYMEGTIVGILSLVGVFFGIKIKNATNITSYKKLLLTLYIIIFISLIYNIFL
jgi:uncharacterized membrane protein YfcA